MLESQQRNILARPERKLLSLNIDAGGMHSRRILEGIIAQERTVVAEPSATA
jgi:vanillate O-demethylase monooxygenase subunit